MIGALEFGLSELRDYCVEKLTSGITADSVCSILNTVHRGLGVPDGSSTADEIETHCVDYIEHNTSAVFRSKGFLQLSKESLMLIIQSSKVSVYTV